MGGILHTLDGNGCVRHLLGIKIGGLIPVRVLKSQLITARIISVEVYKKYTVEQCQQRTANENAARVRRI